MTAIAMRYQPGDTLIVRSTDGLVRTWKVVQRKRSGWLLRPSNDNDPVTWSDDELYDAHRDRRLTHEPCNALNLSATAAAAMEKTWEFWKPEIRREAQRRLLYVRRVAEIAEDRPKLKDAYEAAAAQVYAENSDAWKAEDRDAAVAAEARRETRRRRKPPTEAVSGKQDGKKPPRSAGPEQPSVATVRRWYEAWNRCGRDIRGLLPHVHARGNRKPRKPSFSREETADTYKLMRAAVEEHYLKMPRRNKGFAHRMYKDACKAEGIVPLSYKTFRIFITRSFDDRCEYERRFGKKAAYLRFNVFERRKPPELPLQEVEVDHCLIDLIVRHPVTGKVLGRPWLTAIMDRATRVVLGAHLSFQPPSYATLQRAIAHAMWPKDLRGIPGLVHTWPCFGVFETLFTDNGKEFHSVSLAVTADVLRFEIVPLLANQPWLKGMIERFWGRLGVQVFSLEEGATLSRTPDHYDPNKRAQLSLDEVRAKLLKFIVDEYHHTRHGTLKCTPMERWLELTAIRGVRSVPAFEHVVRLTGWIVQRKIGNVGVHYEGHLFTDRDPVSGKTGRRLSALLARRGGRSQDWIIRIDPFDLKEVWILDDLKGEWISLPNADPSISYGVSRHQHRIHKLIARQNVPPGQPITVRDLEKAKETAEKEVERLFTEGASNATATRAARYAGDPGYLTPMPGPPRPADAESDRPEPARAAPVHEEAAPVNAAVAAAAGAHPPVAGPAEAVKSGAPTKKVTHYDFIKAAQEGLEQWTG